MLRAISRLITVAVACICVSANASSPLDPLGMNNKAIGGGPLNVYTPGVTGGTGLNNIGLLIKTWGIVTHLDEPGQFFYINDGSDLDDKSGFIGVRVYYGGLAADNTFYPPDEGQYVKVTGVSSVTTISTAEGDRIIPMLRVRHQDDLE